MMLTLPSGVLVSLGLTTVVAGYLLHTESWRQGALSVLGPPKLHPHFSLAEMTRSQTATSQGIPNDPGPGEIANMRALLSNVVGPLRSMVGELRITSGYRSPLLNQAVGGSPNSQHVKGEAVDVAPVAMSSERAFELLHDLVTYNKLPLDQGILYHPSRGGHIHLSHRSQNNRGQLLYAPEGTGVRPWKP